MSTPWDKRLNHLNELIETVLDLIAQYETKELLTNDPRERLSCQQNIKSLKSRLDQINAEFQDLEKQLRSGRMAPEMPPLAAPNGPFQVPQLPVQGVFGREEELIEIPSLLALDDPAEKDIQPLSLIGMGGVGKTTLARAIGRREGIRERFPDGVLWAELGPEPNVRLLLNDWGKSLGVDLLPERDEAACHSRLIDVLLRKRVFLIIDDVWDPNAGGYFQVGGPYCRTLLTTREPWIAYVLATRPRTMRVNVLSLQASLDLLRSLAPEVVTAEEAVARQLCERLERLPLALNLAGRLLAIEADDPTQMRIVLGELIERREARLGLLQVGGRKGLDEDNPVSIEAILGMSVERLNTLDQDRFAMLSVFGGEPLTWEINAAASVWECSVEETRNTISHFINRGLVEARPNGRYWMHALLADYAAKMLEERGL